MHSFLLKSELLGFGTLFIRLIVVINLVVATVPLLVSVIPASIQLFLVGFPFTDLSVICKKGEVIFASTSHH